MKPLLDPKIDFVFKRIFGSEKHPNILISFLNAVINPIEPIVSVDLKDTDINKESQKDKFSRLDIKAITSNGEHVNIEIQLKNEYNIVKRSLYYWSKLYTSQLNEGENYNALARTICINILNFKHLNTEHFHSCFRLKELLTNEELTDAQEIHFIEIPKLPQNADITDILVAWVKFLKDPDSPEVSDIKMTSSEIREAGKELVILSQDDKARAHYEQREKANKDRTSTMEGALNDGLEQGIEMGMKKGREEGLEKGREEAIIELAISLLDVLDDETIALKTKLSVNEVAALREL